MKIWKLALGVCAFITVNGAELRAEKYIVQMPFEFHGRIIRELPSIGARVVDLSSEEASALVRRGVTLEKDQVFHLLTPIAPGLAAAPGWHLTAIHSREANALTNGSGQGITVCVLDSGVNLVASLTEAIVGGINVVDPSAPADFHDGVGHGTTVAATIAARPSLGTSGIAPAAGIYVVKFMRDDGSGNFSDAIAGLAECIGKSQIVNMSFGGPGGISDSPPLKKP